MAASIVATGGNEGYAAAGSSPINSGSYSLGATDTLAGAIKWEGSTATPSVTLAGVNSGKTFSYGAVTKHPSLDIWYRPFRARGFTASTSEMLLLELDSAGGGRVGWAIGVAQVAGLSGSASDPQVAIDIAYRTAPGSGSTALTAGNVSVGAGDGVILQFSMADDDGGALTLHSTFAAMTGINSSGNANFRKGQYKIYSAASGSVAITTTVANPVALATFTMALGAPASVQPTVAIVGASQVGANVVVTGTYTGTGSTTVAVTLDPATGSNIGPTNATLASPNWSITFTAPAAGTYDVLVTVTDTVGSANTSVSNLVVSGALAAPVITSAPNGLSPIAVAGTGQAGCTIDIRIDGSTVNSNVATVDANGLWSCNVALSTGTRTLEARQNTPTTADGVPPQPGPLTITPQADPAFVDFSWLDGGMPFTAFNLFRYASDTTADADGVLVGSTTAHQLTLSSPETGWYSIGAENSNGNAGSPWYSHKSARVLYTRPGGGGGSGGGGTAISTSDAAIITWMTPDTAFASTVTGGSFQVDSPTNRDIRQLASYSAGYTGATHSTTGILYPGGSGGDQAYAFSRTTVGGKPRYHHRVGSGLPVSIGGTTYRSEILQPGGSIDIGQEWIMGGLIRFDANMMAVGAPFCSYFDLHHEQYESGNPYGGPGPCSIWGSRDYLELFWSLGVGGAWEFQAQTVHRWVPQADHDYWCIVHGKADYRTGFDAFLNFYLVIDDAAISATPTAAKVGRWGVDNNHSSVSTMYWKQGMYFFNSPAGPGAGPFSRKSAGLIVCRAGGSTGITPARMLATLRALA